MRGESAMLGSVTVLVVLLAICLSVLGASALSSGVNEYQLSQRNAAFVTRYYQLDTLVQDGVFELASALRAGGTSEVADLGWLDEGDRFSRDFILDGEPELHLAVAVGATPDAAGRLPVLSWREWQPGIREADDDFWITAHS